MSNFADHKTASGTCYGAPVPAWSSDSLGLGGTWESASFNKHPVESDMRIEKYFLRPSLELQLHPPSHTPSSTHN